MREFELKKCEICTEHRQRMFATLLNLSPDIETVQKNAHLVDLEKR